MKKKGFTLIEIISTIAILTIVSVVLVLGINKIQSKSKEKAWNELVERVKSSAMVYLNQNSGLNNIIYQESGQIYLELKEILDKGLIDENFIVDERDNQKITDKEDISYQTIKIELNANEGLEVEYPSNLNNYIGSNPKNVSVYSTVPTNLRSGLKLFGTDNQVIKDISPTVYYNGNVVTNPETFSFSDSEIGIHKISYTWTENGKTMTGTRNYHVFLAPYPTCEIEVEGTKYGKWYNTDVILTLKYSSGANGLDITSYGLSTSSTIDYNGLSTVNHTINTANITYYGYVKNSLGREAPNCQITFKKDSITPSINSITPTTVTEKVNNPISINTTYGLSGGTSNCTYNGNVIDNTNILAIGTHNLVCNITGNNNLKSTNELSIVVKKACGCSSNSDCSKNYSCDGCECYYDPPCSCSSNSQCGNNEKCNGCDCYSTCACSNNSDCGSGKKCDGCKCYTPTSTASCDPPCGSGMFISHGACCKESSTSTGPKSCCK